MSTYLPHDLLIEVVRNAPLISIDLIVKNPAGEVLLGWRTNQPAQNCWFVPGGRILKNETLQEAFRRITLKELGVEMQQEQGRFLGVYQHFYPGENFANLLGVDTHYIVLAYEINLAQPLPTLPKEEHAQYQWFSIPVLQITPGVHRNTRDYFS